jgi:hypothetical protein
VCVNKGFIQRGVAVNMVRHVFQCGHMKYFIQNWSCFLSFSTDHLCLLGDYCVFDDPIKIKVLKVVHQPVIYCTSKPPPPSYNYPSSKPPLSISPRNFPPYERDFVTKQTMAGSKMESLSQTSLVHHSQTLQFFFSFFFFLFFFFFLLLILHYF